MSPGACDNRGSCVMAGYRGRFPKRGQRQRTSLNALKSSWRGVRRSGVTTAMQEGRAPTIPRHHRRPLGLGEKLQWCLQPSQ
jgi:hypothetical protein